MELLTKNGVMYYHSALLPCPHGFATRIGGVSTEAHTKSLNLAFARGDSDGIVLENLARFADAVGVCPESVVSLSQVHSDRILCISDSDRGKGYHVPVSDTADGYFTTDRTVSLGVKTADCVPILLCGLDENGDAKAVSALHAGWRGSAMRIAEKGVQALMALGIPKDRIRAAIGPAIGGCCYEVGAEVYRAFLMSVGDRITNAAFCRRADNEEKYMADLKLLNRLLLLECGISEEAIDVSDACTCCHPELFYSHRRTNGVRGTMLSLIALPRET